MVNAPGDTRPFQFTRPQEARPNCGMLNPDWVVSIHAPARGATQPRTGGVVLTMFQFTRPQEARPETPAVIIETTGFNSRARKRRDSP